MSTKNILFIEKPYVAVLNDEYLENRCSNCFASTTNLCAQCQRVAYCDDDCYDADQYLHRYECEAFRKLTGEFEDIGFDKYNRFAARFILRQQFDEGVILSSTDFPSSISIRMKDRTTANLVSHYSDWKKVKSERQNFKRLWKMHQFHFVDTPLASVKKSDFQRALCALFINSFAIGYEDTSSAVGTGLYLNASRFDHSCEADLISSFKNNRLALIAKDDATFESIKSIDENEFNRLKFSYTRSNFGSRGCSIALTRQRMGYLKERYFFECQCPKCNDPVARALEERSSPYECPICQKSFVWRRRSIGLHRSCQCKVDPPEVTFESWQMTQYVAVKWNQIISSTEHESDFEKIITDCEELAEIAKKIWHTIVNLRFGHLKDRLVKAYLKKCSGEADRNVSLRNLVYWIRSVEKTYLIYMSKAERQLNEPMFRHFDNFILE